MLNGHHRDIVIALATLTVATVLKLVPPVSVKLVVDYVLPRRELTVPSWLPWPETATWQLLAIAISVALASIVASLIHLWGRWLATKTVNQLQTELRRSVFEHAIRLPMYRVHELKSGGAPSLLREDAGGAAELVFSLLYNPWRAIVQFVGSLCVLVVVDWRLMLGGLLMVPLVYLTHRTWIQRIRPLWRDVRIQRQEIDGYATEAFSGIRIVRGFSRERTEAGRYVRSNNLLIRQQLFAWWWSRTVEFLWETMIPLSSTCILLYGGYRILQGSMTLGDLTMFLFYLAMFLEPLATLVTSVTTFQNSLAGLERILDLLHEPQEFAATGPTRRLSRTDVRGELDLQNVAFRYPRSERDVLREVNLHISAGETIALVGRSGAGKTTLCNLVARFYDPTHGRVLLDQNNLRDIHLADYRQLLGIVEQDVFLFDGTIAENIGYGTRHASSQAIAASAQTAYAEDFILELPQGYETRIGERGVKLSGGQRQRLAIARALMADPRILILDEATSNLDSESEQKIHQALVRLMAGRTCIVIAHRMSTLSLAHRIVVLDDGTVQATGTHDELVATNGLYQRMIYLQRIHDTSTLSRSTHVHAATTAITP